MAPHGMRMHVISHTHWDREWYLPFERFRNRLVHLIDNLLDLLDRDPEFRCFHLDAQTIVLEDYLEIRPERKARLAERIRQGRIHVGPWYVQNDEFLCSGEATVRNLLEGTRIAAEFGCRDWVGYVPDQFGNLAQLPQIFRGFGLDTVLFGRGWSRAPDEPVEFFWEAPSGDRLLAVFMPLWYNNAQRLPANPAKLYALLRDRLERLAPITPSRQLLLMNGVDHLEAQENLSAVLASIRKSWKLPPVLHSTLPEYFAQVKRRARGLKRIRRELRDGPDPAILNGTLSSRPALKQANQRCEMLLERWLEPFAWIAAAEGLLDYPADRLRYLWKKLLKNHPHDSICGCGDDPMHRDNAVRFRQVEELGEDVLGERLEALALAATPAGSVGARDYKLAVFNPSPFPRSEMVSAAVDLFAEDGTGVPVLRDPRGRMLPLRITAEERLNKRFLSPVNLPGAKPVRRLRLVFPAARVPALGYAVYSLQLREENPREIAARGGGDGNHSMENPYLAVRIKADGSLVLRDKAGRAVWKHQHVFTDEGDAGDLYNFVPVDGDAPVSTRGRLARIRCLEKNELRAVFETSWSLPLPRALNFRKNRRRHKKKTCRITSRLVLNADEPFLRVHTTIENRVRDHRLRVVFPAPPGSVSSVSDCPFDVVERPGTPPAEWGRRVNVNPMRTFAAADNGRQGLAILARGIYAHELTPDGALALTLVRATGRITAGDANCPTEGRRTEDSQLLGRLEFDYAIFPFLGSWQEADLPARAERFSLPLRAVGLPVDSNRLEGGRPWAPEELMEYAVRPRPGAGAKFPAAGSFLNLGNDRVLLSAMKKSERGDSLLVRLFNPTRKTRACTVRASRPVERCRVLRLDETPLRRLPVSEGVVRVRLRPKQILTLALDFA